MAKNEWRLLLLGIFFGERGEVFCNGDAVPKPLPEDLTALRTSPMAVAGV
jgi:hypothetical protein